MKKSYIFITIIYLFYFNSLKAQTPYLVKDINPSGNASSSPMNFLSFNGMLFFAADNGTEGYELWKSDGTDLGTVMVKDIGQGGYVGQPYYLTDVNGILFFAALDNTNGVELWKSDGTTNGTTLIKDNYPGMMDGINTTSYSKGPVAINNTFYFSGIASDTTGYELFKSDGTDIGTTMIKDINFGAWGSSPHEFTEMNGILYFTADDGTFNGSELWKSDGTETGTMMVKDIDVVDLAGSQISSMIEVNGNLFFAASSSIGDVELWKSDGTDAGTILVKDIKLGDVGSTPVQLTNVNGVIYFVANDSIHGAELWKSDGTDAGTVLVKDIFNGTDSGLDTYAASLTNINGVLLFYANNGTNGIELWKTDGTEIGTVMVKDILPGNENSIPTVWYSNTSVNGIMYFVADDGVHGYEIWKSDGTSNGTVMINEGNLFGDFYAYYLTNVNGKIFFSVLSAGIGEELWAFDVNTNGINEIENDNFLVTIFPNPSNGVFTIKSEKMASKIEITTLLGNKVYSRTINSDNIEIDLSNEAKGIYFYQIENVEGTSKVGKIIVK